MIRWSGDQPRRRNSGWLALAGVTFAFALVVALSGTLGVAVEAAPGDDQPVEFDLLPRNGSGISATARLTPSESDTRIEIVVNGPDAEYLPYLHRGTCDEYSSDVSIPLAVVRPGSTVNTTVDLSVSQLTAGGFLIDLHIARGSLESLMDPATSVSCGLLAIDGSSDEPLQTPVAGIGPFDSSSVNWVAAVLTVLAVLFGFAGLLARRVPPPVVAEDVDSVAVRRLQGLFV